MTTTSPQTPDSALRALLSRIVPNETEAVSIRGAQGRVLADEVCADRPSPPADVSAMDGFCVHTDAMLPAMRIQGEVRIGSEAPRLEPGCALRIVTGAHVPATADAILRVEDVRQEDGFIVVDAALRGRVKSGEYIRRAGENAPAGMRVLPPGTLLRAPQMSALAALGPSHIAVHRTLRVALLITGDELVEPGMAASPWQIRDSNTSQLETFLARPWLELDVRPRVGDDAEATSSAVNEALATCDALILTGGVSMGHRDHVPNALREVGVDIVFHRLAQRPGKPLLGGVTADGRPVLALPGNPVSVLACARRFALDVLARRAGIVSKISPFSPSSAYLRTPSTEDASIHWYKLVKRTPEGLALLETHGSGDLVALAESDGFVEIAPHATGLGPFPFYACSA